MGCQQSVHHVVVEDAGLGPPAHKQASQTHGVASEKDFDIVITKHEGDLIGAGLGATSNGACFVCIKPGGIFDRWNQEASEEYQVRQGHILSEVNGVTGYWDILQELRTVSTLSMKIRAKPPPGSRLTYFQDVARMAEEMETQRNPAFVMRLQPQDPEAGSRPRLCNFPRVRAEDAGMETCGICLEDVDPGRTVVQLPCKHGFHALCAVRWLAESGSGKLHGNRQCCPLCCRRVVGTSDGGIATVDE